MTQNISVIQTCMSVSKVYCTCTNQSAYLELSREPSKRGSLVWVHECRKPTKMVWVSWQERCPECLSVFSSPWEFSCRECFVDSGKPLSTYRSWTKAKLRSPFYVELFAWMHLLNCLFGKKLFYIPDSLFHGPSVVPQEVPSREGYCDTTGLREALSDDSGPISGQEMFKTI